jgi:uncharacterized membrane protein YjdF
VSAERSFKIVAATATVILLIVSLLIARPGSTYRFAFLFLVPFLWALYGVRNRVALRPAHFALFASFLIFHDLGVFGLYRQKFFGLQFDVFVHFYFGVVGGFIVLRALQTRCGWTGWWLVAATGLFMLGLGAVHELIECGTTIWLGKEKGMLKLDPNDPYDTQKDLMNNLLGAMLACMIQSLIGRKPKHVRHHRPASAAVSTLK